MHTNPEATPSIDAPRKTHIVLKVSIKKELDWMESNNIIKRVTVPTDWVSSLAYSEKQDGKLCICLDH